MEYIKWVDGLSKVVKILLAIFLPILFLIYRVIKDATANNVVFILLDIFLGIVGWVMDIVHICQDQPLFSWGEFIKPEAKPAEEKKPEEEKKDDTAAK
jgi:uncharacterized membrane protein YqaE (UPF0057 family)